MVRVVFVVGQKPWLKSWRDRRSWRSSEDDPLRNRIALDLESLSSFRTHPEIRGVDGILVAQESDDLVRGCVPDSWESLQLVPESIMGGRRTFRSRSSFRPTVGVCLPGTDEIGLGLAQEPASRNSNRFIDDAFFMFDDDIHCYRTKSDCGRDQILGRTLARTDAKDAALVTVPSYERKYIRLPSATRTDAQDAPLVSMPSYMQHILFPSAERRPDEPDTHIRTPTHTTQEAPAAAPEATPPPQNEPGPAPVRPPSH